MFAAVVVPLLGVYYSPGTPSPRAALVAVLSGTITRVVLEFAPPKDGYLILPYDSEEFYDYGPGASSKYPVFFDFPADELWDPAEEPCMMVQLEDYTGADSLAAFLVSIISFVAITMVERATGKPLFTVPGLEPYEKELESDEHKDGTEMTKKADTDGDKKDEEVSSDDKNTGDEAEA